MAKAYHEALHPLGNLGIQVSMAALENTHIPAHWHEAMEILFCLNGSVRIHIEHEHLTLQRNQLIVFDSKEVHSIHSDSKLYMFLCIHVDKKQLSVYCPDLELYHIKCRPIPLNDPKSTQYIHICQLAHDLTRMNVENGKHQRHAFGRHGIADACRFDSLFFCVLTSGSNYRNQPV